MAVLGPLPDSGLKHLVCLIMPERELVPRPAIRTTAVSGREGKGCSGPNRGRRFLKTFSMKAILPGPLLLQGERSETRPEESSHPGG